MESFVPACVWVKEKETARNWMGYKVYTPFSGLPQHALCGAGLIALSNSQPSLWHHIHPETSQPALMNWLRLSGCQAPDSHGAFVCTQNEVLRSLAENLSDTVSYAFIGQNTKMFSQNIASAHPTVLAEKQNKVTVSPSAFTASPPSTFFFSYKSSVTSSWKVPGVILVLQHAAGWTQIVGIWTPLLHIAPLDVKTRARGYTFLTSY